MPEEIEEKKEFLKREEIRTMRKDIARLRKIEAQKERERIAGLEPGEVKKGKPPPPPEIEKAEVPPEALIPKPLPKRPSPFKKVLVRGLIVVALLLIFGSLIWSLVLKKPAEEEVTLPAEEEIIPPEEEIEEKPEISIPPSLISVAETETAEISQNEEIPGTIYQLMAEELPLGTFTRIVIKNTKENRLPSLEDLAGAFQVEAPEEIFQKLEPDYTLALYSQEQGKRVAFVTKIKEKSGLTELLKAWEPKLEKGISISGQEIPALVPYFKETVWNEITFRYLTISKQDLGICYLLFDNYFILTSSWESMVKMIDKLTYE